MNSTFPPPGLAEKKRGGFLYRLGRLPFLHRTIAFLQIYPVVNFLLAKANLHRMVQTRDGGLAIRIRSIAAMTLAEEIFKNESYGSALKDSEFESFVDLGCNVGWFVLYAAKMFGKRQFSGLMIDANPEMIEEARWHLNRNGIEGCETLLGAVGCEPGLTQVTFHLNPSDTQSAVEAFGKNHPFPVKGKVRPITVPALVLKDEWTSRFGTRQIDLLKIDIEGAELLFLKSEIEFLQSQVRKIVCEWHQWHVTFEEMDNFLTSHGFTLQAILEEDEKSGVASYLNQAAN